MFSRNSFIRFTLQPGRLLGLFVRLMLAVYLTLATVAAGAADPKSSGTPVINGINFKTQYHGTEGAARGILDSYVGRQVTAALLQEVLDKLNRYYRTNGYPYATAYYPEQIADNGYFTITVAEPKVGLYELQNRSSIESTTLKRLLGMSPQGKIKDTVYSSMHERLLMLHDLDMTKMEGFYAQDDDYDPLKLYINIKDREQNVVDIFADNHATKAAGRYRAGVHGNLKNLSGHADTLRFFAARSGHNQNNVSASYEMPLNTYFTTVGAGVCYSDYELGDDYRDLDATGSSLTAELFVHQPLWRTPNFRLDSDFGGRYRQSRDRFGVFDLTFKNHSVAAYAGVSGWWRPMDSLLLQAGVRGTFGKLFSDDDYGVYPDHEFGILNFDFAVSYDLCEGLTLRNAGQAQLASAELDSSDSFQATGPMALPVFDTSAAVGDSGIWDALSLHYRPFKDVNLTVSPHVGSGYVKNRSGSHRSVSGAGISVAGEYRGWHATLQVEKAIGSVPAGQDEFKVWLKAGYRFA